MKRLSIFFAALMACTLSFAVNYEQVTDASTLKTGDVLVIGSAEKGKVAAAIGTGKFLTAADATISEGVVALDDAYEITLSGDASAWTLTSAEGVIGATEAKTMAIGKGTTTWTISIDKDGKATITCGTYGKILYNVSATRFLNYTSNTNTSMLLPELYKKAAGGETPVTPVAVESIALDQTELSLEAGKTATLVATITPANATNKEVTWTSNAETIATVADGVVTAVAEGKANITVTTADGAKTATCAVTVTAAAVNPEPVVTFDATKDKAGNPITTLTKDGITLTINNGTLGNGTDYRIYKNATLTITSTVGKINSVEFTCTADGTTKYGPGCFEGTGYEAGTGKTGTWTGNAEEFTLTAKSNQVRATKIVVNYTPLDPDAIAKPTFTTEESDFMGSITVALGADADVDIYYTLDGTEPTTASTKYTEPFILTATTTVKAVAYNATANKYSEIAEKTYTAHTLMTCAEANAAKDGEIIFLGEVSVAYVNGANTFVKDETGYALVYKYDFGLVPGQVVKGIKGAMNIFNALPEIEPSVTKDDLTITEGTVPTPEVITTAPTMADINKYIKMEGVAMNEASFTSAGKQSVKGTFAETELTFYNTFKIDQEFEARKYNVIGFVSAYKTMQIAVVSAEALYNITATANDETMGTVAGAGEFVAGAEVTLKATPAKGYQFVKWSNDETANPYTFTASDDVTLTAEFSVVPKHIYAYNLNSKLENGSYTFTFNANEDATAASLIFYDATTGELAGEVELANVVKGANTHVIAADALPGTKGQTMVWAVELEANPVNVLTKIYADEAPAYRRGYANVDANPESDFFGQMYVADRVKTKANSRLYVYDQNYVTKDANGYQLGESVWDFGRFGIAQDGTLYLSDYGDAHSGIYVVNPADLTKASQFFVGTRTSTGLIKNGDVETGSSIAACSFVGTGANAKLVAVAEDYTGKSFPVAIFNVGQEDGTIAATWDAAPSKMFDTKGNLSQNFDIQGCEKGVWVAQSRADGQNNSSATSLRFYDWDGNCTWSSADHTDVINGSLGGGVALTANENQVIVKAEGTSVKVFDVTWAESTPTLTLAATYDCGYTAVSTISLDYAGNMIVVGGTAFGSTDTKRMSAAVFSVPTSNNISVVPAKKAMSVTKTAIATNLEDINVNGIEVKKIVRDGQVYIIRDGKTYNMMGQVVE